MKSMMLIPTLAVALVTVSASWNVVLACSPSAGQCCTGAVFREGTRYCQITNYRGKGQFAPVDMQKRCWFSAESIGANVHIPRPGPLGTSGLGLHSVLGTSGSTHQCKWGRAVPILSRL